MATSTTSSLKSAMTAPFDVNSDLVHPPNVLWRFNIIAQTMCMAIAGTLFLLRCFVRLGFGRLPRQWVLEDYTIPTDSTELGLAIYSALLSLMVDNHAGVHMWNLTPEQTTRVLYYFYIETIIYGPFIFFTKLSILLLYLRLLIPTRWSPLWTTIHIFIGISLSFYSAITLVKVFQCSPVRKAYAKTTPGHCINVPILLIVSGLFNTISDALILLVPIKACWNLKMSWKKKVAVCAVFTIGAIAPIFSAIGFAYRIKMLPSKDMTYINPLILLWGTAEVTTGVICACLPTLPSLFRGRLRKPSAIALSHHSHLASHPRSNPEGSIHSYPQNKDLRYGTYVELSDTTTLARGLAHKEVVTTIKGGVSPAERVVDAKWTRNQMVSESERDFQGMGDGVLRLGGLGVGRGRQSGIVKTVRIEQTGGC
ncbi:hypothetical protein K504DRAFT_498509 [Pleomassaria siparia CBS 279.74]|uniref:Rhodopsin domain-containing protein n=1 Tax=Pleomassaria siparia CBS 279.74 TaxID=1314801 RepID=A0A6G1KLJ6_9PLEO|nr:hypothetical protein K504DRAFT_498509 [Pleomassaria siparia CBS 279.74]